MDGEEKWGCTSQIRENHSWESNAAKKEEIMTEEVACWGHMAVRGIEPGTAYFNVITLRYLDSSHACLAYHTHSLYLMMFMMIQHPWMWIKPTRFHVSAATLRCVTTIRMSSSYVKITACV